MVAWRLIIVIGTWELRTWERSSASDCASDCASECASACASASSTQSQKPSASSVDDARGCSGYSIFCSLRLSVDSTIEVTSIIVSLVQPLIPLMGLLMSIVLENRGYIDFIQQL